MTAQEFKDMFEKRYVFSNYDCNVDSMLKNYVISGIYQCLLNQEKILKKLNELDNKQSIPKK